MGNTGRKIYPWLIQVDDSGTPTGVRKPNLIGDADYVPPAIDYDNCPIPVGTTTTTSTTTTTTTIPPDTFQFSISNLSNTDRIDLFDLGVKIANSGGTTVTNLLFAPQGQYEPNSVATYGGLFVQQLNDYLKLDLDHVNTYDPISGSATVKSTKFKVYYTPANGSRTLIHSTGTIVANGSPIALLLNIPRSFTGLMNKVEVELELA